MLPSHSSASDEVAAVGGSPSSSATDLATEEARSAGRLHRELGPHAHLLPVVTGELLQSQWLDKRERTKMAVPLGLLAHLARHGSNITRAAVVQLVTSLQMPVPQGGVSAAAVGIASSPSVPLFFFPVHDASDRMSSHSAHEAAAAAAPAGSAGPAGSAVAAPERVGARPGELSASARGLVIETALAVADLLPPALHDRALAAAATAASAAQPLALTSTEPSTPAAAPSATGRAIPAAIDVPDKDKGMVTSQRETAHTAGRKPAAQGRGVVAVAVPPATRTAPPTSASAAAAAAAPAASSSAKQRSPSSEVHDTTALPGRLAADELVDDDLYPDFPMPSLPAWALKPPATSGAVVDSDTDNVSAGGRSVGSGASGTAKTHAGLATDPSASARSRAGADAASAFLGPTQLPHGASSSVVGYSYGHGRGDSSAAVAASAASLQPFPDAHTLVAILRAAAAEAAEADSLSGGAAGAAALAGVGARSSRSRSRQSKGQQGQAASSHPPAPAAPLHDAPSHVRASFAASGAAEMMPAATFRDEAPTAAQLVDILKTAAARSVASSARRRGGLSGRRDDHHAAAAAASAAAAAALTPGRTMR